MHHWNEKFKKYIDPFQIVGFIFSFAVSLVLVLVGQDTLFSLLIGLTLAVLTQLFDLQARIVASEDKTRDLVDGAIRSLEGVKVKSLTSDRDMWEYVSERIDEAQEIIDDLTMNLIETESTPAIRESYGQYAEAVSKVCSRKEIKYREIMAFPTYIEKAEAMLEKFENKQGNYLLRYYYEPHEEIWPSLIQFMIIDGEEVIFAFYRGPSDIQSRLAVKHPDLVDLFKEYYQTMWDNAKMLKEGEKVGLDALREIRKHLSEHYDRV